MFGISKQLLIALTLGAVAMILNQVYLSTQMEAMDPGKKVQVLLAKKDIRAGSSIVSSMVDRRMIPELYAPKASVRDFKTIEGQEVAVNILAGDYILSNDIADRRLVGMKLSQQIDPKDSSRALTISVDELNSLSRSLTIGDRIDIIFSFNIPGVSQKLSVVLLQNSSPCKASK